MADLTPEHTSRRMDGDLHPEVRAAYRYVESVVSTADAQSPVGGYAWHGWSLREAFLAGCTHARTQLAQPELTHHITPDDFRRWWRETGSASPAPSPEMLLTANAWAQYCLDRWGRPTPRPPSDEEVGELVRRLKELAHAVTKESWREFDMRVPAEPLRDADLVLTRAAELLQRFASPACVAVNPSPEAAATLLSAGPGRIELLPDDMQIIEPAEHTPLVPVLQPVPVAERLPGPEDCDAQGRCWLLTVEDEYPQWRLHSIEGAQPGGAMIWVPVDSSPGVMVDCFYTSHWLPAHALPLPTSEEASR